MARYQNILETIGNTPVVRLNKLAPAGVNVYVKVEAFNPMGSVKDRMALAVIEDAERSGALKPGQTVIEATSGNTGIGLAMVCAQKGYPLVVTMAESFSVERRKLLRFLGAKVVLTPAAEKGSGMLAKAVELAETHGWFLCRQFENQANADVHSRTTAREILDDFADQRLDYFVTGFGTGGTLKGVARELKRARPGHAHHRRGARQLAGVRQRHPAAARRRRRPGGKPSAIPPASHAGLGAGFHFDADRTGGRRRPDRRDRAGGRRRRAASLARARAARKASSSARRAARRSPRRSKSRGARAPGSTIVCMLPDTGERYLSTPLFEDIGEEMTAEEWEVSRSTPLCRFDAPAPTPRPRPPPRSPRESGGRSRPRRASSTKSLAKEPVVMFALEWCEFCWSVRKLFAQLGIAYRSVDVDSVEFQKDDLGGRIRARARAIAPARRPAAGLHGRRAHRRLPRTLSTPGAMAGCSSLLDKSGVSYDRDARRSILYVAAEVAAAAQERVAEQARAVTFLRSSTFLIRAGEDPSRDRRRVS